MSNTSASPSYDRFVGIDVAAATVTVAWGDSARQVGPALTIEQTPLGYTTIQPHLTADGQAPARILVVLEATGTQWLRIATTLAEAGFQVSVIHPWQAHTFAKALLKRAQTDAIDAQTLAQLAALLQPPVWAPPPAVYTEVQQRLAWRDDLQQLRTQVRNQLHALIQQPVVIASVRAQMEPLIATLEKQVRDCERERTSALQQDAAWAAAARRWQPIPGVGLVTASWLLVATLKFSLCPSPEAAVSYAGLAPVPRESGTSVRRRPRSSGACNHQLRRVLYMATLSAAQQNPVIKVFDQRLRAARKPKKVARCAAARKLLHIAWAVVTKERDFDPVHAAATPISG